MSGRGERKVVITSVVVGARLGDIFLLRRMGDRSGGKPGIDIGLDEGGLHRSAGGCRRFTQANRHSSARELRCDGFTHWKRVLRVGLPSPGKRGVRYIELGFGWCHQTVGAFWCDFLVFRVGLRRVRLQNTIIGVEMGGDCRRSGCRTRRRRCAWSDERRIVGALRRYGFFRNGSVGRLRTWD